MIRFNSVCDLLILQPKLIQKITYCFSFWQFKKDAKFDVISIKKSFSYNLVREKRKETPIKSLKINIYTLDETTSTLNDLKLKISSTEYVQTVMYREKKKKKDN